MNASNLNVLQNEKKTNFFLRCDSQFFITKKKKTDGKQSKAVKKIYEKLTKREKKDKTNSKMNAH